MTDTNHMRRVMALFTEAVELDADVRDAFLVKECAGDDELLAEVRALLAAEGEDDSPIHEAVQELAAEIVSQSDEGRLDQRIGNYRLIRVLGSGGMGSVYLAERADEQFEHQVAVKILQTGRSDEYFVQRFRAERQLLAGLSHPNIARLLDGGETDDKLPYLVMEYVEGLPIDKYCDEQRLDVVQRLELFKKICRAVDYAHRNLVVHRDIKPSNILIGGDGEPKLLDFGVAKMIDADAATQVTVEAKRMLTPEYASPEQVRGEPASVSTDIYSLGVLLYRLLCGRTPYRVRDNLPSDLARAILEDEPSKPSAALDMGAGSEADTTVISAQRHSSPARLRARLEGDLDNIALMALRKEPEHRYESARAFFDDIDNYLAHRPVLARPAGVLYRARKFARRHRTGLGAAAIVVAVLIGSAVQIIEERDRAEIAAVQSEEVTSFLAHLFQSASPEFSSGDVIAATDLLAQGVAEIDELDDQPVVQARLLHIMGKSYAWLGYHTEGIDLMRRALVTRREHAPGDLDAIAANLNDVADIERVLSNFDEAERLFLEAQDIYRGLYGEENLEVAMIYGRLGDTYRNQVKLDDARANFESALAIIDRLGLHDDSGAIDLRGNLALVLDDMGRTADAIALQAKVVDSSRRVDGDRHPNTIVRINNLALMQTKNGDFESALATNGEAFAYAEKEWATDFRIRAWITYNRANMLRNLGRIDEAEALHRRAIDYQFKHTGEDSQRYLNTLGRLGRHYLETAEYDKAGETLERVIEIADRMGANPSRYAGRALVLLADVHNAAGRFDRADDYAQRAAAQEDEIGRMWTLSALREHAESLSGRGRFAEAAAIFEDVIAERTAATGDVAAVLPYFLAASRHYRAAGQPDRALVYARRAFDVAAGIRPADAWPAAEARGEYGLALRAAGETDQALPLIREARTRLAAVFGEHDPRVLALSL